MRISFFYGQVMGIGIWQYFGFQHHSGLWTTPKISYLGKITLVSIWIRMVQIQIITQVYKILSSWHTHLIWITWLLWQVWYPQILGSLISLLTLIIDNMHSPAVYSVQHWFTLLQWTTFHNDDCAKCMAPWLFHTSGIVFYMIDKFVKTLFRNIIIISLKLLNEQGIMGFVNIYMNKVGPCEWKNII